MDEDLALEAIKRKTVKGITVLTGRNFFLQAVTLLVNFLLTVFLNPAQYGVFFLVQAVINFFSYFSDIGLAAALVQKKDPVTDEELKTTFTVQQSLVMVIFITIVLLTPLFVSKYHFDMEAVYLLWALAFSLVLSSLKTIPSVLLERKLDFNKLVIPQIIEALVFNFTAVILAWRGFGITSFTVAVLARGIVGLLVMYYIRPWRPGLMLIKSSLKSLLRFGLPYQVNTFLALLKDDGMTVILGLVLGTGGIGLLGWAQKWATAPLRFFMDQVIRVTFPAYARMQHDRQELSRFVSRSVFFICFFVFPALVGLVFIAPLLTEIIPKYSKWQPALLALTLIAFNSAWAAVTTPLTNMLNAVGQIKITFKLMIMWTILTWIFVPALAINFGVNGAALGYAIVGASSLVAIIAANRKVKLNILSIILKLLASSAVMGIALFYFKIILPVSFAGLAVLIVISVVTYLLATFVFFGRSIFYDTKMIAVAFLQRI